MARKLVEVDEKESARQEAMNLLNKRYGEGAIFKGEVDGLTVRSVSSGSLIVDSLLGCGGLPRGRTIEIYGKPSAGKTALALFFIAQMQRSGGSCAFVDVEQTFNPTQAKAIGVNTDNLYLTQAFTIEQIVDTLIVLLRTKAYDMIVVDSVAAMMPLSEMEAEGEKVISNKIAGRAQILGKVFTRLNAELANSPDTIIIFINHAKDMIGVWSPSGKPPTTTPGGSGLKFLASIRFEVFRGALIKKGNDIVGNVLRIKVVKNKVGPPERQGKIELYYMSGVDMISDTFDAAEGLEIIKKTGNTYAFKETKLGLGREGAKDTLRSSPDIVELIRRDVGECLATGAGLGTGAATEDDSEGVE